MAGEEASSFPPAEGIRLCWDELPMDVRSSIESRAGSRVVATDSRAGGFSPGLASHLRTADGDDLFVKAVSSSTNWQSVFIYRREVRVARALPSTTPAPRLRWWLEEGDWVALAFDFVNGATPCLPWGATDLERVLDAMVVLAESLSPSPIAIETAGEFLGETLMRWRDLERHPDDLARIPAPWQRRLNELIELEAEWPESASGSSLVHLDIRADNVLLTPDDVWFVDWPWAALGAPWLDLVAMLPSVAMQCGPDPMDIWASHPLSRGVDDEAVDSFLAAFTGMLTRQSLLPPTPGLPTLRAFQAGQGRAARRWLARRRGWTDAVDS
jgi:hypothetical protein